MCKPVEIAKELLKDLDKLIDEAKFILAYAHSKWDERPDHLPNTSNGFAMCVFSRIDLYSTLWLTSESNQTVRMARFLHNYCGYPKRESEVAVQLWRHNLMHTGGVRPLYEETTGTHYKHLFHYELQEGHWLFTQADGYEILAIGLLNLMQDLRNALLKATKELEADSHRQSNWQRKFEKLSNYKTKLNRI